MTRAVVALTLLLAVVLARSPSALGMTLAVDGDRVVMSGTVDGDECGRLQSLLQQRGIRTVVLTQSHGGNAEALSLLQARCAADGDDVLAWRAATAGGDAHAGRTETSLMLAIDAAAVRLELAEAGCTEPLGTLLPRLRAEGVRPVSSNGVLGDPAGASADEGRALLDALVTDLASAVASRWSDR